MFLEELFNVFAFCNYLFVMAAADFVIISEGSQPTLTRPSVLHFQNTEVRVSGSDFDSYSFSLDGSQAASGSHVANAVFATAAPTATQQGKAS